MPQENKIASDMNWGAVKVVFAAAFLLIGFNCSTQKTGQQVEIIATGTKDLILNCPSPGAPISIISDHTGSDEGNPFILHDGEVVFFIYDKRLIGIGWDSKDLSRGGQIMEDPLIVTGSSITGDSWWHKISARDKRFRVSCIPREDGSQKP
ncbi:hypothetical protein P3T73_05335 [Kiritimatiellota bacterium B12222]|nr:hypothetical protein P3T73_05335 [Kiritimatiellota bacterium B12222]